MTATERDETGRRAWAAFERDLPRLWEERPGEWVAYRGDQQLGFAKEKHVLYQRCFEQGWKLDDFFIFCIEPIWDEMIMGVDTDG